MAEASGKSEQAFRTIGELAADLGVPQHILRYWETRFPQLKPLQRAGNRRYYRPADVALAHRIHRLLNRTATPFAASSSCSPGGAMSRPHRRRRPHRRPHRHRRERPLRRRRVPSGCRSTGFAPSGNRSPMPWPKRPSDTA
jgi:hypothetical protein